MDLWDFYAKTTLNQRFLCACQPAFLYPLEVLGPVLAERADISLWKLFALVNISADLADPAVLLFKCLGLRLDVFEVVRIGNRILLRDHPRLGHLSDKERVRSAVELLDHSSRNDRGRMLRKLYDAVRASRNVGAA